MLKSSKSPNTKLDRLKQRASAPKHQQAQADALFASIGEGAITTDEEGKINRVNQVALDQLGRTKKELLGAWMPGTIIALDNQARVIEPFERPITKAFLTGKAISQKAWYQRSDGSTFPVAITVSPIMLGGRPIGAVEVFRNITKEQEIDRMKTEFIYLASHQLRTPLSAVKTYAHMLDEGYRGPLTAEQSEFMNIILVSLNRMNDIISTLLNVSRMEAGKMTVTPSPVSLTDLLGATVKELEPTLESKGIKLKQKFENNLPILTDAVLVREVVVNLLSNAIKYTPKHGNITISLEHKAKAQVVSVKDTGYGIPKAAQAKLFTKFYRAPNVIDKTESGTGLGLYLVKGIVEVLRGKIWFKSQEGKGTTFYFSIPCLGTPPTPPKAPEF